MKIIQYSKDDLTKLESWRGLLSVFVFIAHLFQILWYPIIGADSYVVVIIGTIANISVVCFFVLSGVLIAYSGLNLTTENNFNWKKYLINRISRIYPSYIFILVISFILIHVYYYINDSSYLIQKLSSDKYIARDQFYCSIYDFSLALQMRSSEIIQVNGPLWSLIIEWWLYIAGLFLVLFLTCDAKKNLNKIVYAICLFIPLYYIFYHYGITSIFYILIWFMGFLFTLFFYQNKKAFNILISLSIVTVLIMVLIFGLNSINIVKASPYHYGIFQISIALIFLKTMFQFSLPKFLNKIGNFSYTLYICHYPIILFSFALTRNLANNNPFYVAIEMLFSFGFIMYLSYIISVYTEDKSFFKNYFEKLNNKIKIYVSYI